MTDELKRLEKRSRRMNILATKSHDRRIDWVRHTLDVVEQDVNKGGGKEIEQAQTIAKGKYSIISSPGNCADDGFSLLVNSFFPGRSLT